MADIDYIDTNFQQQGNVCVLASYGTVLHYFSDGELSVDNLLSKYSKKFELKPSTSTENYTKTFQNQISDHFHGYCGPKEMRGFEFIKQLHENDELGTKQYCQIVYVKATLDPIDQTDIKLIKSELENNDSLAIILCKITDNQYHAVTIGYNAITGKYFCKDPEQKNIIIEDYLNNKVITEYIVFKNSEKE